MAEGTATSLPLHKVTYHAVARYVERILGINVTIDTRKLPPTGRGKAIALAHCNAVGKTIDDIRAQILTPAVMVALQNGFRHVGTSVFVASIDPATGCVVTIKLPACAAHKPRKASAPSKREAQRRIRRADKSDDDRRKAAKVRS